MELEEEKTVSTRISKELHDELLALIEDSEMTKSEYLRENLKEWILRDKKELQNTYIIKNYHKRVRVIRDMSKELTLIIKDLIDEIHHQRELLEEKGKKNYITHFEVYKDKEEKIKRKINKIRNKIIILDLI